MMDILYQRIDIAMKRAYTVHNKCIEDKCIEDKRANYYSNLNSCTTVYELIEEINKWNRA